MSGPYETSGEALRDAAHVYDAARREERRGTMSQVNEGLLLAALAAAGVQLGRFERGIAGWLAGYEPETVLVVIGWIERARSAENLAVNWAHHVAASRTQPVCGRCRMPFDPADTRFDGRAEERSMPGYCRGCVGRCHDSEDAFHVCVICRPAESGQRDGGA